MENISESDIKVSVIVPIYNGQKYIERCATSILNQTLKEIELILVDDGSHDNSLDLCNKIKRSDIRVVVYHQKNKGTTFARKKGIEIAKGAYCMFADQDDYYCDKKCMQYFYEKMIQDDLSIMQFGYYKKFKFLKVKCAQENKKISRNELMEYQIKDLLSGAGIITPNVWNKIYKRAVLLDAIIHINESLRMTEDICLNIFAFTSEKTKSIELISNVSYCWHTDIGYSSETSFLKHLCDYEKLKRIQFEIIRKYNLSDDIIFDFHLEAVYMMITYIKNGIEHNNKVETIMGINKFLDCSFIKNALVYFESIPQECIWNEIKLCINHDAEEIYNSIDEMYERKGIMEKSILKVKSIIRKMI